MQRETKIQRYRVRERAREKERKIERERNINTPIYKITFIPDGIAIFLIPLTISERLCIINVFYGN